MPYNTKIKSAFVFDQNDQRIAYSEAAIQEISAMTDLERLTLTSRDIINARGNYSDIEIIFSSWGSPVLNQALLAALPKLKAVFYAAGSTKIITTDHFWESDILLTSAFHANALPVAEYTVASIVLGLKNAWRCNRLLHSGSISTSKYTGGVYKHVNVGIVSLGAIGSLVCEQLKAFDLVVHAYDPVASEEQFDLSNAHRVDSLGELFRKCHVVSIHAPLIPQTEGMITGEMIESMPNNGLLINTSRGAIINEEEMIAVLSERKDIQAVIDVTSADNDYFENPLKDLPNVFLTPHIAGAMGGEKYRLGDLAVEECKRFLKNETPLFRVNRTEMLARA